MMVGTSRARCHPYSSRYHFRDLEFLRPIPKFGVIPLLRKVRKFPMFVAFGVSLVFAGMKAQHQICQIALIYLES
jgi:hypothetical protein